MTCAWWERIVHRDWGHVDLVMRDFANPDFWILMESFGGCPNLRVIDTDNLRGMLEVWVGAVLWFRPRQQPQAFPMGFQTCVTLAKATVGCGDWRIQTPRQLHQWALRNGGLQVGS